MTTPNSGVQAVRYIGDALTLQRSDPARTQQASFVGWITRASPRGKLIFFTLRDATGHVQVKCTRDNHTPEAWSVIKSLSPADRVAVQGTVGFNRFQDLDVPTVFAVSVERLHQLPFANKELLESDREAVTKQFFLARLRGKTQTFLRDRGFEEFDSYYLSSRRVGYALASLRVVFPGFGAPTFMAPSAATQLFTALFAAPSSKVFCFSRCFSNEIRDGYTSAESPLLCLLQLNPTLDDLCALAEACIKAVFGDIATMPALDASEREWLGPAPWERRACSWESVSDSASAPCLHILPPLAHPGTKVQAVFRVVWPDHYVLVEGHTETLDSTLPLGGFTLHLERMVPALRSVTLRRLTPL